MYIQSSLTLSTLLFLSLLPSGDYNPLKIQALSSANVVLAIKALGQALYIPDTDSNQPLDISIIGSGSGGTTYAIVPVPTPASGLSPGATAPTGAPTFTLIENQSHAIMYGQAPQQSASFSISCSISGGVQAVCDRHLAVAGSTSVDRITESVDYFTTLAGGAGATGVPKAHANGVAARRMGGEGWRWSFGLAGVLGLAVVFLG